MFKGGTSLSKVFGLIVRFSEGIDLILDWKQLTDVDPVEERSKTQQEMFNRQIVLQSQVYIKNDLLPKLNENLNSLCRLELDETDPNSINIRYPSASSSDYLRPEIKLEIGPLASWVLNGECKITSYAAQEFPHLFSTPECSVRAINAERTFWEKATILHHEAHRPEINPQPSRYSRYYYDLAMMAKASVKESALADMELLANVVESKLRFYPRGWAKYELANPGSLRLCPPDYLKDSLKRDFREMEGMIFGECPKFEEIIGVLKGLEMEINS